jgi:CheY-like chemotaxis protein
MAFRILVVDDEEDVLALVMAQLSKHGYDVLSARDGEEALNLIRARRPDLVILDHHMPGLDGTEVCRRIKADPELLGLPVMLLTASLVLETTKEIQAAGFNARMTKPYETAELLNKVEKLLEGFQ